MTLLLVAAEQTAHQIAFCKAMAQPQQAAATLGKDFQEARQTAMKARRVHSTVAIPA